MKQRKSLVVDPRPNKDHPKPSHLAKVRKKALTRDNGRCQTCFSDEDLELHHRTYDRFGEENLEDLIMLCKDCHEAITESIRRRRYNNNKKPLGLKDYQNVEIKIIGTYETCKIELKDYRSSSPDHAQRSISRPSE
jgi:hypothetical protein